MNHFYMNIGEDWFTYPELYKRIVRDAADNSHFVEVGSWKGRSACFLAVEIINSGKNIKLDCVDIWKPATEYTELNPLLGPGEDWLYNEFLKSIEPVKHVINPIRSTSVDASKLYNDNQLDFVFIDAGHDYDSVIKDIRAWHPKVKSGGIVSGHDYGIWPGVAQAVNEFYGKGVPQKEYCWEIKKK